jgi:hypothetical protein
LGEFSPIGQLFSLGSLLKITQGAQILGLLFSHRKSNVLILAKSAVGNILGDFFTSLSGHPAWSQSEIYNYIQRQR